LTIIAVTCGFPLFSVYA